MIQKVAGEMAQPPASAGPAVPGFFFVASL